MRHLGHRSDRPDAPPVEPGLATERVARLWLAGTVVLLALTVGLPWLAPDRALPERATTVAEVWILAGLMAAVIVPLRRLGALAALSKVHVAALVLLGAGLLWAQHERGPDRYPLKRWDMYTVPAGSAAYLELEMLQGTELVGPAPVADLVPTHSSRAYLARLRSLMARAERGDAEAERIAVDAVRGLMVPMDEIDGMVVRRCTVSGPTAREPADCREVMTIDREGGR